MDAAAAGTSTTMLRARRKDVSVKPNRRLDRRSSRGMIFENEELRLRTISINAEVEKGQNDIKKLRRENEQLRREIWGLRDEYDRLEQLLAKLQNHQQQSGSEEENDNEEEGEDEHEHESDGNGTVAENARNQQKMSRGLSAETEDGEEEEQLAVECERERIAAELVAAHRVQELCARVGGPRCRAPLCFSASPSPPRALPDIPEHRPVSLPREPDVRHYPTFPIGGNLEQLLLEEQGKRSNVCRRVANETVKQPIENWNTDTSYLICNGSGAAAAGRLRLPGLQPHTRTSAPVSQPSPSPTPTPPPPPPPPPPPLPSSRLAPEAEKPPETSKPTSTAAVTTSTTSASASTTRSPGHSTDISDTPATAHGFSTVPQNCIEKSSSSPCLSAPKFRSEVLIHLRPPAVGVSASASTSDIHNADKCFRKFCNGLEAPDFTAASQRPAIYGASHSREDSVHRDDNCTTVHADSRGNACGEADRSTRKTDVTPRTEGAAAVQLAAGEVARRQHARPCGGRRRALRLSCDWPAGAGALATSPAAAALTLSSASTPCTPLRAPAPLPLPPATAHATHSTHTTHTASRKPEGTPNHSRPDGLEDSRLRNRSPVPWCSCWGNGCI